MRDSVEERVEGTLALLRSTVREVNLQISGDWRVGEADAARLIGLASGTLRNLRTEGTGPYSYGVGIGGGRVTYRLHDLAVWIERRREH